jgi:Methyltransferase domain
MGAPRLQTGQLSRDYVDLGKAEFLVADLEDLALGDRRFDLVFAVRVCPFHREPARARALVERWLAQDGRLEVFFDTPGTSEQVHLVPNA